MFPISQNMMESSEDGDMVSDCMNTYDQLIDTNVDYDLIPMPLHHVRESSYLVAFVINGGNGFVHYTENHGWDVRRISFALQGLIAVGLGYLAIRLQPYVDQISAASDLLAERNWAMETAWKEFAQADLKAVEHAWIFESKFTSKAKAYLMANVAFTVVPSSDFKDALSRYRSSL